MGSAIKEMKTEKEIEMKNLLLCLGIVVLLLVLNTGCGPAYWKIDPVAWIKDDANTLEMERDKNHCNQAAFSYAHSAGTYEQAVDLGMTSSYLEDFFLMITAGFSGVTDKIMRERFEDCMKEKGYYVEKK